MLRVCAITATTSTVEIAMPMPANTLIDLFMPKANAKTAI